MPGLGRKVFTAGDVLTASDVQNYLMDQSVMYFAGTAARSSAIATPTTGMTTYNQTSGQLETYNGSAYIGMSGLQLVKKQTIGSGVSSVSVTNAFNATYPNYKIIVTDGVGNTSGTNMQLILTGSTTGYYLGLQYITYLTNVSAGAVANNLSSFPFIGDANTNNITMNLDLMNPFQAQHTRITGTYVTNVNSGNFNGYHAVASSYSGFTFSPSSGTLTGGTIYVYGYGT